LPDDIELFYADESGFDEYYSREYGYAQRGELLVKLAVNILLAQALLQHKMVTKF